MNGVRCELCGNRNVAISTETGLCANCMEKAYAKEMIDTVNIPNDIIFRSKLARMGKRRIIQVPKKQLGFLSDDEEYIIIIKKFR